VAHRWILARLRNRRLFSLAELNAAIRPLMDDLNARVMRDYGASHARNPGRRSHVTVPDHMPSSHRRYAEWTPARILTSAEKLGPSVAAFCQIVMESRPHPEQGFRTCLGVLSLAKSYEPTHLIAACQRGVAIKARSVASIVQS